MFRTSLEKTGAQASVSHWRTARVTLMSALMSTTLYACDAAEPFEPEEEASLGAPPAASEPTSSARDSDKAVSSVQRIDTTNRAAVVSAFNSYFNVAEPALQFSGSGASCQPGTISLAVQEWTVTRINFLRAMAGFVGDATLDSSFTTQAQAAALMMAESGKLSHTPTSSEFKCWTAAGNTGAGSSCLALMPGDALMAFMADSSVGNEFVGHRRAIMSSITRRYALGRATGSSGWQASALATLATFSTAQLPPSVAWPPRGFVPLALFPSGSGAHAGRWSFSIPAASGQAKPSFANATVSVTLNNVAVPVTVVSKDKDFWDATLVWELPAGHVVTKNTSYHVIINGVTGASTARFEYDIFPIDPAEAVSTAEAVECFVFGDGEHTTSAASDAVTVRGPESACVPTGTGGLTCAKWFGCRTAQSKQRVTFKVFDDGNTRPASATAVYMRTGSQACIPDGTPTGTCRKWFGDGTLPDGRKVKCSLFGDAYADLTGPTPAIYYRAASTLCMPDGTPQGRCRRWFGRCTAQ